MQHQKAFGHLTAWVSGYSARMSRHPRRARHCRLICVDVRVSGADPKRRLLFVSETIRAHSVDDLMACILDLTTWLSPRRSQRRRLTNDQHGKATSYAVPRQQQRSPGGDESTGNP